MRTLELFYEEAKKAFEKEDWNETLLGIEVTDMGVYFVGIRPEGGIAKTLWREAAPVWEGIYRGLKSL